MKTNVDILLVTHAKAFGGAERHTLQLLAKLSESNIKFGFLYCGDGLDSKIPHYIPSACLHKVNAKVKNCNAKDFSTWYAKIGKFKARAIVIIKPSYFAFDALFILLTKAIGSFVITIEHSLPIKRPTLEYFGIFPKVGLWRIKDEATRLIHSIATDKTISVSEIGKKQLITHTYLKRKDIAVCENGICFEEWQYDEEQATHFYLRHNIDKRAYVFGCIGHLFPIKAFDLAIDAFSLLKQEYRDRCYLCIVGSGPEHSRLNKLIQKNNLTNVLLIDHQTEMLPVYSAIDTMLITSKSESAPLTLLEGIACGCNIIASDTGNCEKVLNTLGAGTIVKSRAPDDWTIAIEKSLDKSIMAEGRRQPVNAIFRKKYSLAHTIDRFISCISHTNG